MSIQPSDKWLHMGVNSRFGGALFRRDSWGSVQGQPQRDKETQDINRKIKEIIHIL